MSDEPTKHDLPAPATPEVLRTAVAPAKTSLALASTQLAEAIGIEKTAMLAALKSQCFRCDPAKVSNEQLAAFVSVANSLKINPLLPGFLYAYPTQGGGIMPMMGPDLVLKLLAERADVDYWRCLVYPAVQDDPEELQPAPMYATAQIFRRDAKGPLEYTAYINEWKISTNPNWNTRPRHMLWIRAIKQCARQLIHGLPFDEDDRRIIIDACALPAGKSVPESGGRLPAAPLDIGLTKGDMP